MRINHINVSVREGLDHIPPNVKIKMDVTRPKLLGQGFAKV